jgi:Peptidase family S41/N-terminal domain of Peptidase_S41 in eukaryotic IRBP
MDETELTEVVEQVRALVEAHYLYPQVAAAVSQVLAQGLAEGRYLAADAPALATAVTADLQSVNGDKHLRLKHHDQALPRRAPGDDSEEFAAMARWADQTCGGVACARRLAGNVGYLDLQPVLFPAVIGGEIITAAMTLLAASDALIIDLRHCLGGEPGTVPFLVSYLWDHEPAQLTGLRERNDSQPRQAWTLPYVPGRRLGKATPVYVLTSAATFSGGEQLSYDLQQLGRATVIGERTRGGAHAREGFRVHPHLEATISVAEAVHPKTGGNWEGTGVTPDIQATAAQARDTAHKLALQDVITAGGAAAAEASAALAAAQGR